MNASGQRRDDAPGSGHRLRQSFRSRLLISARARAGVYFPSQECFAASRRRKTMELKGSKTEQNLKDAFSGESQANRRYLYFAQRADVEGFNDVATVFRSTAEGETGHAHGHLEYLEDVGDPATGEPIGNTEKNLKAAIAGETHEYTDMYPGMAKTARDEGFDEIADWFETLARAERSHANRFQKALDELDG
jgi:rubrerythrin